jgi:hypothetical protein
MKIFLHKFIDFLLLPINLSIGTGDEKEISFQETFADVGAAKRARLLST